MRLIQSLKRSKRLDQSPTKRAPAIDEPVVFVDYPREGDKIRSAHYSFRIGVPKRAEFVEVSIDEGSWRPCRYAAGYWWYDLSCHRTGRHRVSARARILKGGTITSEPRGFEVIAS